jgi:sugar lactone lactonase YvrE
VLMLVLVVAFSSSAAAGIFMGRINQPNDPHPIPPFNDRGIYSYPNAGQRTSDLAQSGSIQVPGVSIGQPGLSYRYVATYGTSEVAYPSDTTHLNFPTRLFIDGSDNLYISEESGHRVLGYNNNKDNILELGLAGGTIPWATTSRFFSPGSSTKDSNGNLWVADGCRLMQFNPTTGSLIQSMPAEDNDPASCGTEDDRFQGAWGIAISPQYMFVSEWDTHRVKVFSLTTNPPSYVNSIGELWVPGIDNRHFENPDELAVDSSGRVYIVDFVNNRVQRCQTSSQWVSWSCSQFGPNLNSPEGITITPSDVIYIADSGNGRVISCNTSGLCTEKISGLGYYIKGVAVDSSNNIFVADWFVVRKFDSNGQNPVDFLGIQGVPYTTQPNYFNLPWGLTVAPDGGLYVTENSGFRVIKLNSEGQQQWAVGEAGVWGNDNQHFGSMEGNPAVDAAGTLYVTDTPHHRVQVFDPSGNYLATMGETSVSGDDNAHFDCRPVLQSVR